MLPSQHLHDIELESEADSIETFESMLIPALLQTPDYIRQVMQTGVNELTDEEIEQRVGARQRHQRRLTGDGRPTFHAIVDENALRRPIDSGLMREQCAYLLEVADLPGVRVQVLPVSADLHAGHGQMAVLTYDDIQQAFGPPIGDIVFHKEDEVRSFRDVFAGLTFRSLSTADSTAKIEDWGNLRMRSGRGTSDIARPAWRKSRYNGANGQCVEVGVCRCGIAIRDSKNTHGPALTFATNSWERFLTPGRR